MTQSPTTSILDDMYRLNIIFILFIFAAASCRSKDSDTVSSAPSAVLQSLLVSSTDETIGYGSSHSHLYRECDGSSCTDDQKLFVFFPGSDGAPSDHKKIAETIGKTGIRVLVLAYQNNGALQTLCGTTDSCYSQARQDRVEGSGASSYVQSVADGVKNRLLKALQKLQWNSFYSGNTILWDKIILGGFSQGAGVAAWIGKHYSVLRICQFSGTWDHTVGTTSASWLSASSVTAANRFYGFTHKDDSLANGVSYLDLNWQALGMGTGAYELYTTSMSGQKIYANDSDTACIANTHGCSVMDSATPILADGTPRYANAWKYVCGR